MADCKSGYFGDKCLRRCHCKSQCEVISGNNCTVCEHGWEPPTCEECSTGSYGDKCSSNCSQQCIAEECHHVSGMCNLGCKPGYDILIDPMCETLCELGKYGEGCIHDCHCANGNICDGVTGDCAPSECEQRWIGSSCNSHKNDERRFTASEVAGVAGGSVGGCLLLLGLVFACVLVYRRYKSASTKLDTTNVTP
ncbi:multiple epidermal growth factor-like domains protein 10 [Mya arenaria]|uniref:multiple epidermal growth factor-like domains protein 10 n=1 Tax=Mya arenaria TaxID=6604 RepID=UPI0022E636D2|nr:multiple epidermal growth factor-like domains protein 10 [Mya arenaria]